MASITPDTVAAEIRAVLGRAGKTRGWLAEQIGMQPSGLSRRMSGKAEFTLSELNRIADALGVPVSDLLPGVAA